MTVIKSVLVGLLMISPIITGSHCKPKQVDESIPQKPPAATSPLKLALLVGINTYHPNARISPLAGCINDVKAMKTLLKGRFEFPEENIVTLINEQATHAGMVKAFQEHLINKANGNTIIVFHYSGHGSQMKDTSGDEADKLDETLVPYDSRQGDIFDISDDEINDLLQQLCAKTPYITFIFDACHSGTATRAAGRIREIPADMRIPPETASRARARAAEIGKADLRREDLPYTLLAGCLSKQSSYEYLDENNTEHGALTYFLTQELSKGESTQNGVTWRDIFPGVKGAVMSACPGQEPQLEGKKSEDLVFGDRSSLAQCFIEVSPQGKKMVIFAAGQVQGMTKGSLFDIYVPGTKKFEPPETPIARARVGDVTPFAAAGELVQGANIPPYSRAVEREHNYADRKLVVALSGLSASSTLQAVQAELGKYNHISTRTDPYGYHLLLREARGKIITEGPDTLEVSPPVKTSDPDAVAAIVSQVNHWAKWYNILSITNPSPQMIDFTINVTTAGSSRDPFAHMDTSDAVMFDGEIFECRIKNTSGRGLYLSLLDLTNKGLAQVIFPFTQGANELLAPDSVKTLKMRATVPEGQPHVRDILRAYVTEKPVNLRIIDLPALAGGERGSKSVPADPLEALLEQAAAGTTRDVQMANIAPGEWATADRVFVVKKTN